MVGQSSANAANDDTTNTSLDEYVNRRMSVVGINANIDDFLLHVVSSPPSVLLGSGIFLTFNLYKKSNCVFQKKNATVNILC